MNSQGRSVALRGEKRARAHTNTHTHIPASSRNFVFVSRRDFTTMLHCHPRVVAYARLPLSFDQRSFLSRAFWYGYTREGRLRRGMGGSQRACADVAAPLFVRFTGTGVN